MSSSTPLPPNEPFLASYLRVQRGKDRLQDLIEAFPSLERKALSSPSTVTEVERRQLLDLPDIEEETENIRRVSSRSREELISLVLSDPGTLLDDELKLLERRFWSEFTIQEVQEQFNGMTNKIEESADRIFKVHEAVYLPNENRSFIAASQETWRRHKQRRDDEQSRRGDANPATELPWMHSLSKSFKEQTNLNTWGYLAFFDGEAQKIDAERRDQFERTTQGFFRQIMQSNGAYRNLLHQTWKLFMFNAPSNAFVSTERIPNADNAEILRNAFHDLLDEDKEYLAPQEPDPRQPSEILKNRRGFLTNTFLVIDKICVDSVLDDSRRIDDMRILAFEADFPQPDRKYIDGYPGWTWLRLEQLVDTFYGTRMNDDPGMDVIWKAAQGSKNRAFASLDLDLEEAGTWTGSTLMSGPLRGSILGRRRRPLQQ